MRKHTRLKPPMVVLIGISLLPLVTLTSCGFVFPPPKANISPPEIHIPSPPDVSPTTVLTIPEDRPLLLSEDLLDTKAVGGIVLIRKDGLKVKGCEFIDAQLSIENAADVTVEDSVFRDRYRHEQAAITVYRGIRVTVSHNLIQGNYIGIGVHESGEVTIRDNTFLDNLGHNAVTIDLGSTGEIYHNYFYNSFPHAVLIGTGHPDGAIDIYENRIEYSVEDAIDVENFSSAAPSLIHGNAILYTGWAGITVEYGSFHADLVIEDNYIAHSGTDLSGFPTNEHRSETYEEGWKHGILLEDCSEVTIRGNTIIANRGSGIELVNARGILLEKNTVTGNAMGVVLRNYEQGSLTRDFYPIGPEDAGGSQASAIDNEVSENQGPDWYIQQGCELVRPADPPEMEFRGLIWRTIDRYLHPGIYAEMYNPTSDRRLLNKAKEAGANFLLLRAFYSCSESGDLTGNDAEAEDYLGQAIDAAHAEGFGVFLTPYVESACFWPDRGCALSEEDWTEVVLKWANFAEEHDVELFAPGFEMSLIFEPDRAAGWYKKILPELREVYAGRVAVAEHPYIGTGQWEVLDREGAFVGYDCFGIAVFPWKRYGDEIDMRSLEDYRADVAERVELARNLAHRHGIDRVFISTLGMDLWRGGPPDPMTRAKGYELGLEVVTQYGLAGVFLHSWASEPDQLGSATEVEEMLSRNWAEAGT